MAREVFCAKLKKELPGLDEPPFDTELGKKIYENISQEAWRQWTEFCKMAPNESKFPPFSNTTAPSIRATVSRTEGERVSAS